jgi:subtilase family serine protease
MLMTETILGTPLPIVRRRLKNRAPVLRLPVPSFNKVLTRAGHATEHVAAACVAILLFATSVQAAGRQALRGHVPRAIADLNLQPVGLLPGTNRLHLAIGLPLRNQEALGALLQQLYDPASPNYRHYLTPAQFAERFGPTPADYQVLIDFAKANGLRITRTHPNRVVLDVEGSVADIERVLHVTLREYQHPQEARTFYAPDAEPSLDLAVPVLDIAGLDSFSLPHPANLRVGPAAPAVHVIPQAGSQGGQYIGNDFRAAYVPGTSLYGTGQSVALVEFDGYYTSDITHYEALANLSAVTLTNIPIDGGPITPGSGNGEVSLDIEMAISMAPSISRILVYEGTNGVTTWLTILNQIATDDLANQVSCSWSGGSPNPSSEQVFQQMAAQGQSFFNASGDSDAFTGSISFPCDSTNITEVGGTTLSTTGPGGSYVSETVWNWGVEYGSSENGVGSSGGISTYYSIPPWQLGVNMATNQGSTTKRNVPDVALTADHVFVAYNNGATAWFGGTSCAAPLWAGFTALVNQQAAANGLGPVGFLNPALYAIGTGTSYTVCFHDVTTGNNEWSHSKTKYTAVTGYDLCTGWGTPNGTNLINALVGTPASLLVTPANLNYGALIVGQSSTQTFSVINGGQSSLTGTATVSGPFAIVSGSPYNVAGGQTGSVAVSFSPTAADSFTTNVVFTSNGGISSNAVTGVGAIVPLASFSGAPTNGVVPLAVTFTDTSTGTITNRFWDFGDSTTTNTTATNVQHTYNAAGTNTVTLIVSGPLGDSTNTRPNYVTVLTTYQGWQMQYFGCIGCAQAAETADPDGDGQNNLAEFLAGTDPTNSASAFHIISIVQEDDDLRVGWLAGGGRTNVVQAVNDAGSGFTNSFSDLSPLFIIPGAGDVLTNYLDVGGATNAPSRYYRVRLVP